MEKYVSVDILETGHKMITEKTFSVIAKKLKAKKNDAESKGIVNIV